MRLRRGNRELPQAVFGSEKTLRSCEKAAVVMPMRRQHAPHAETMPPWRSVEGGCSRKIPAAVLPWIHLDSSMTLQLQHRFGPDVTVQPLKDGPGKLHRDERYLLPCCKARAHVREVMLASGRHRLIVARTVFNPKSLRLARQMMQLGSQPLGQLLFANGNAVWLAREFARVGPAAAIYPLIRKAMDRPFGSFWARRSLFLLDRQPLLVTEVFLPAMFDGPAKEHDADAAGLDTMSGERLAGGYAGPRKTA